MMKECERNLNSQKRTNAQKEMSRLYKEFGEDGILALLRNVAQSNGTPPPAHTLQVDTSKAPKGLYFKVFWMPPALDLSANRGADSSLLPAVALPVLLFLLSDENFTLTVHFRTVGPRTLSGPWPVPERQRRPPGAFLQVRHGGLRVVSDS